MIQYIYRSKDLKSPHFEDEQEEDILRSKISAGH